MTRVLPERGDPNRWDLTTEYGRKQLRADEESAAIAAAMEAMVQAEREEVAALSYFTGIVKTIAPDWRTIVDIGATDDRVRGNSDQRWSDGARVITVYRGSSDASHPLHRLEGTLLHELAHLLLLSTTEVDADSLGAALAIEYADLLHSPLEHVLAGLSERAQLDREKDKMT